MKRTLLTMAMALGLASGASAHIGDKIYLIFEIPDADRASIDLKDGSVADWEDVVGDPSLVATDFYADPTVGEGAQYDPADLDYRIWLGWNSTDSILYLAQERVDNVYINTYPGGNVGDLWSYDSVEFMLDGDHTGGDYTGSADVNWTADEQKLNNNRTAQQYLGIATSPDGKTVGYLGAGAGWVNELPYADGGGGATGEGPTTTVMELYVTPFDDLIWNSPGDSKPSALASGKIIGFKLSIPDFDTAPQAYRAFHTLTGQAATWRYAERFADGRLVGSGVTAVESETWGRVKASFDK